MTDLREQIRLLMKAQGKSMEDLAKESGVGYRTLRYYLNGETSIGIDKLEAISRALNTHLVI